MRTLLAPLLLSFASFATSAEALRDESPALTINVAPATGTIGRLAQDDLHVRNQDDRSEVVAASRQARRARLQSAKEWLLMQLGGPSGFIDHSAISRALDERALLVHLQAKRWGLPALPTGWTNVTGYPQSSGRINHILFTSATGNNILAGADGGGIWRSADAGATWAPVKPVPMARLLAPE